MVHNGTTYGFTYDTYGNRKAVTINGSEKIRAEYRNKNGLIDRVVYATGEAIRNEYNEKEQLVSQYLVSAGGYETKLFQNTYDNYGNLVEHKDYRNLITTRYQRDMIGRLVGTDDTRGLSARREYDEKNRVAASMFRLRDGFDDSWMKTEYIYGDVASIQKPSLLYGIKVDGVNRATYSYDALCRMKSKTLNLGNAAWTVGYQYMEGSAPNTTTALVKRVTDGANNHVDYTYDANGNILTISENGTLKVTYYYDELNRLVREDNVWQNKTICYTYDIGGNILSWKEYAYTTGIIATDAAPTLSNTYTYGNTSNKDQLTAWNGMPITYDAMGNPEQYKWWTFGWEKGRQLVSVDDGFAPILYYYDNEGRRIQKRYFGEETNYYWNGNQLAAMYSTYGLAKFIYDEAGKPMIMIVNGVPYYYQTNLQGDVIGLLDVNGTQVVSYSYNSWGRMVDMSDTSNALIGIMNPFRYRGYILDDETGLYYVGARYYDPETGRFISPDTTDILTVSPMDLTDKNLYAYCDDNPVVRMDANGQIWVAIFFGVVINFTLLAIETAITGEDATMEDVLWCYIGGITTGALGHWFKADSIVKALAMGAYAGIESTARGGDAGDCFTSFGAATMGSVLSQDPQAMSVVIEQGTNILVDTYSDIIGNKSENQLVSGNAITLNIVTGGINSCVVKTNSNGTAAKVKPTSGAIVGNLKGIASNLLPLFR